MDCILILRWWIRRMCAHRFLCKLQNCNWLLNNHWQEKVGFPPEEDTPSPRANEKPKQDSRRGEIAVSIKLHTCQKCLEGSNKISCTPRPKRPNETDPRTALVFDCLLRRYRSAVACCSDRGYDCSRPVSCTMWHQPSWKRSPLIPP